MKRELTTPRYRGKVFQTIMTPKHYRMLPDRYNYENFKGAVREPKKLRSEFQRVTRTIEQKIRKKANRTFI